MDTLLIQATSEDIQFVAGLKERVQLAIERELLGSIATATVSAESRGEKYIFLGSILLNNSIKKDLLSRHYSIEQRGTTEGIHTYLHWK